MVERQEPGGLVWVCAIIPAKLGSFEWLCIRVAERASAAAIPVHFVFEGEPGEKVAQLLAAAGASWSIVPACASLDFRASRSLIRLLAGRRPTIAHFHYCSPSALLYPWLRMTGCRLALTYHLSGAAVPAAGLRSRLKALRSVVTTRRIDRLTAVSDASRRKLAADYAVPAGSVSVIYNGVELHPAAAEGGAGGDGGPQLIIVAALIREKGVDTAIRALAHVRRQWPGAKLTVVGEGPERQALTKLVAELGVADAVRFLGLRNDVPELLLAHDIALVPSRWSEAYGLALAEAMAARLPVVASRVGGIPEIVTDGVSGLLRPPDDPVSWSEAIASLAADPSMRALLGHAARKTVQDRFSMQGSVDAYWTLYRELVPFRFGA